jgi:hypothetical protein
VATVRPTVVGDYRKTARALDQLSLGRVPHSCPAAARGFNTRVDSVGAGWRRSVRIVCGALNVFGDQQASTHSLSVVRFQVWASGP